MKKPSPQNRILKRHHAMVADPRRTPVLEQAITQTVKKEDVVFELGCGTGVLTLMALKAGASKVYACEIDDSIEVAKRKVKEEGFLDRTFFYNDLSNEVSLPEPVDVIVAETVGSLGFNENILPFVNDARDRFLKKGGTIIPMRIAVSMAPMEDPGRSTFNQPKKKGSISEMNFRIDTVRPEQLLSKPQSYCDAVLLKNKWLGFDQEISFTVERDGLLTGFAGWMEVEWIPGLLTRTSPWDPETHWKQTILSNAETVRVRRGDRLLLRVRMGPQEQFSSESFVEWGYRILKTARPEKGPGAPRGNNLRDPRPRRSIPSSPRRKKK